MATVNKIQIVVEAEDKATAPISRATEATKRLGEQSRKITKESKKDWGGLGDLFSQVLPRSLQKLSRGFKGTQRQVGRLAKGFKALKSAWAAMGIGVVILALEEVISNWSKYSDMLGLTSEAGRKQVEVEKKQTEQLARTTAELEVYKKTATDVNALELDRVAAVKELAKTLPRLANIDLNAEGSIEKINEAYADLLRKDDLLIANEQDKADVMKSVQDALTARVVLTDIERQYSSDQVKLGRGKQALEFEANILKQRAIDIELEFEKEKEDLQVRQQGRLTEINLINKRISDELGTQADAAETLREEEQAVLQTQREAEAERKRIAQQKEADIKWLANQRITIAQETELRLIQDEEQRELRSLEIQHEAAKEELRIRGGTLTDKLLLEQNYLMDKEELTNGYKERADEKATEEDEKAKQDKATLTAALATDQQNELLQVQDRYSKLQELAVKDGEESKKLAEQLGIEEDAINTKYEKKKRQETAKTQALKIKGAIASTNALKGILGSLGDMAEEGNKKQRDLAIVEILLSQAISIGNSIAGATAAGAAAGPGAPVVTPLLIAQMVGQVLVAFAGIKGIMDKAGASMPGGGGGIGGGGGGGGVQTTLPLPARLDTPSDSNQAYVVQSQLQGQLIAQAKLDGQIIL